MRRSAPLPLAAALFSWSLPAAAGPLAEVAHGVEHEIETHDDRPSPPPDPDPPGHDDGHDVTDDRPVYYTAPPCDDCDDPPHVSGDGHVGEWEELLSGPARLDIYVGAHPVVGSQGALVGDLRVARSWLGLSASDSSYFEKEVGKQGTDSVRLDLMAFAVNLRLLDRWRTSLWLDGGLAATGSSEYDTILGAVFGVRAEHQLTPQLSLFGQGRMFRFDYGVDAVESWAGVRAWFVSAGYRVLRFDIGPPLHGPEAGVALRF